MIKVVSFFSLGEGQKETEVWDYEIGVHAEAMKQTPGLRKYTVSRAVKALPSLDGTTRIPDFWIMVEMWFDDEEAHENAFAHILKDKMPTLVSNPRVLITEEVEIM